MSDRARQQPVGARRCPLPSRGSSLVGAPDVVELVEDPVGGAVLGRGLPLEGFVGGLDRLGGGPDVFEVFGELIEDSVVGSPAQVDERRFLAGGGVQVDGEQQVLVEAQERVGRRDAVLTALDCRCRTGAVRAGGGWR